MGQMSQKSFKKSMEVLLCEVLSQYLQREKSTDGGSEHS